MIGEETVQAAKKWCETGANWINNGAVKLGLSYLDRSISVFSENGEMNWLTFARHSKLDGLKRSGWEEDAEAMFDEVMRGYHVLRDSYGQALLLCHLAECMAHQGRGERALTNLHLAISIAEADGLRALKAYLLSVRAGISMERDNLVMALRLFRQAEELLDQEGQVMEALHMRYSAAEALLRLGERADAAAFLEDLQTKLMRGRYYRDALDPLNLLGKIYEESGSWDERDRITELVHLCGQSIVQGEPDAAGHAYSEPEVRLVLPPPDNDGGGQDKISAESAGDSVAESVAESASDSTRTAPPKA